jgi:energy-coupling factor transporter transmembrane protein EcfT
MLKLNIITQLFMFFVLAIIINILHLKALVPMLAVLVSILMFNRIYSFMSTLKRFRWLFLVMMIIFSFNTPGEHIQGWPFSISPTYEGTIAGLKQILRVVVMLTAISWVMAANTRQQLISGFYFMFLPLKLLGLEVERFSARLWLTIHYVELQRETNVKEDFMSRLKNITTFKSSLEVDSAVELGVIEFVVPQFNMLDYLVIAILLTFSIQALL